MDVIDDLSAGTPREQIAVGPYLFIDSVLVDRTNVASQATLSSTLTPVSGTTVSPSASTSQSSEKTRTRVIARFSMRANTRISDGGSTTMRAGAGGVSLPRKTPSPPSSRQRPQQSMPRFDESKQHIRREPPAIGTRYSIQVTGAFAAASIRC